MQVERKLVVSAAIVNHAEKRLFVQRRSGKTSYAWHWCTPGGKAIANENPYETLMRELYEEHGVVLMPRGMLGRRVYEHEIKSTRTQEMTLVQCLYVSHEHAIGEYKAGPAVAGFDWVTADELKALTLTPADDANRDKLLALIR